MRAWLWPVLVWMGCGVAAAQEFSLQNLQTTARAYGLDLNVDKTTHPGEPAVVLLDRLEKTREYGSGHDVRVHRIVKVLCSSAPGVSAERIIVPAGALQSLVARTHAPSGEVIWLSGSDFHRETIQSRDPMSPAAELVSFAFPAVEDGALLEYGYAARLDWELSVDVHIFGDAYPVQVSQYVIGYPKDGSASVYLRPEDRRGSIKRSARAGSSARGLPLRIDSYEARDLPAVQDEEFSLSGLGDQLHMFIVDAQLTGAGQGQEMWDRLAKGVLWAEKGARFELEAPVTAARRIARKHATAEARAQAVAGYLKRKLRIETKKDVSGRTLEEILEKGEANPVQFSMLLASLLSHADVQARIGLVNSSARIPLDKRVPWSGFFDRWLVVARGSRGGLYFDTLSPDLEKGLPRSDCQGRPMLMASVGPMGELAGAKLVTVPYVPADRNSVERRAEVRLAADGSATVSIVQTIRGEGARDLNDAIRTQGQTEAKSLVFAALQQALPDADFGAIELAMTSPSSATARATITTWGLGLHTVEGHMLVPGVLSRHPVVDLLLALPLADRRLGIDLSYAQRLRTTVSVEGAPGIRFGPLPAKVTLSGPAMHFEQSMERHPQGFRCVSELEIANPAVKREALASLGSFLRGRASAQARAIMAEGVSPHHGSPPPP